MLSANTPTFIVLRFILYKLNTLNFLVITGHPLGMEKETIANYQISSSSYNHYSNRAHHARLNLDGGWCAKNTDVFQYIRVSRALIF